MSDSDFDFWLGRWEVRWAGDGRGTNTVRKILGDRVVLEEFDGTPGIALKGNSFSVFDPDDRLWRQTWVDSEGNYLLFEGGLRADGAMELRGTRHGEAFRMVWSDIEADTLTWVWERSEDGSHWQILWTLEYARIDPGRDAPAAPDADARDRRASVT